jgi:multicomponent Na+:H+ antiporter subunit F
MIGMIFLSITTFICLIRAILGPRFTDRVLGINVINVKIIILICMLAVFKDKAYLVDISLVYAAISFLSVVVLSKIFLNDYLKRNKSNKINRGGGNNGIN